jgi:hypothetical protein
MILESRLGPASESLTATLVVSCDVLKGGMVSECRGITKVKTLVQCQCSCIVGVGAHFCALRSAALPD